MFSRTCRILLQDVSCYIGNYRSYFSSWRGAWRGFNRNGMNDHRNQSCLKLIRIYDQILIWLNNTNDFHFVDFSKSCVETVEIRSFVERPWSSFIPHWPFKPQYPHTNSPNWSPCIPINNTLREVDKRSKHFPLGDYFNNSHIFSWLCIDIVRRK